MNWLGHSSLGPLAPGSKVRLPDGRIGTVESVDPQFDDAVTIRLPDGSLTSREPTQLDPVASPEEEQ